MLSSTLILQLLHRMNLLLFVSAALFCIVYPANSTGVPPNAAVPVGCFRDNSRQRALPILLKSWRGHLDWNTDLKYVVVGCALEAQKLGYTHFGVQFYGECWSGPNAHKTYDMYGSSSDCTSYVGMENTNLVYRRVGDEKECQDYMTLNSADRSALHQLIRGSSPSCDSGLLYGWYRFSNPAGNQMASSCALVPSGRCGTIVTGWLNTAHPNITDGITSGEVCFNWGSDCCMWSQIIHLRNCGRFYVYKLRRTFNCPMGFCGITASV